MQRDFSKLHHGPFDLLVIGGGIYGAWTAYDASLKGYKVALVEKTDWASGTSSASSKLIHGGLRYLEYFNFGLVKHGLAERATLTRIAPHAVDPVRFVIPKYESDRVSSWRMRIGLALYDILAGPGQPVARHDRFTVPELREAFPYLDTEGLIGGFSYGDCQEDDARLTLEVVAAAEAAGAVVVNHAKVTELLRAPGADRVTGAVVENRLAEETVAVKARLTINAAGPWAPTLARQAPRKGDYKLIKGVHLMMPKLPGRQDAFLLTARSDGRVFFVIPWYDHTIVGTTESDFDGDPANIHVTREEAEYLLAEANRAMQPANWGSDDICGCFAGVRTLVSEGGESLSAVSRDFDIRKPNPGLWMPVGGKYTTARGDAEEIVDEAQAVLGPHRSGRRSSQQGLLWAPARDEAQWLAVTTAKGRALGLDERAAHWLAKRHGNRTSDVLALVEADKAMGKRLHATAPFIRAEVVYAATDEMAITLDDIIRRRMPLTLMTQPDDAVLDDAADMAGKVLGWDADERASQIDYARGRWPYVHAAV